MSPPSLQLRDCIPAGRLRAQRVDAQRVDAQRAHPQRVHAKRSGFTFMELLIVMVIITIIVGYVAPNFAGFTAGRKADNTAREIVALCTYARSQSIAEGRVYHLNFDATGFWLTTDTDGEFKPPTSEYGQRETLPDGVRMAVNISAPAAASATPAFGARPQGGNIDYITFRSSGRGDTANITLTDANNRQVVVTCASPTELFHIAQPGETITNK